MHTTYIQYFENWRAILLHSRTVQLHACGKCVVYLFSFSCLLLSFSLPSSSSMVSYIFTLRIASVLCTYLLYTYLHPFKLSLRTYIQPAAVYAAAGADVYACGYPTTASVFGIAPFDGRKSQSVHRLPLNRIVRSFR